MNRWIQIFRDFRFLFWHEFNIYLWTIFYSFGLLWLDRKRTRSLEETTVLLFGCAVLKTYTCNFLKPRHKSIHKWNKNVNSSTLFKFLNIWISVRMKEKTQLNFDYFWISLLYLFQTRYGIFLFSFISYLGIMINTKKVKSKILFWTILKSLFPQAFIL